MSHGRNGEKKRGVNMGRTKTLRHVRRRPNGNCGLHIKHG